MTLAAAAPVFRARSLARRYGRGDGAVRALDGVDLELAAGEALFVAGPSGSGKSTLLHLLGALDRADAGSLEIEGRDVARLGERERALLRRGRLGFVFQAFHLVPVLSALENVEYPLWIAGVGRRERHERAAAMLAAVGLAARARHRPDELSGGERQRVAVARALVHRPAAVLADEPTGNLDSANARAVVELLLELNREHGTALVVATHDAELLARAPRRLTLRDGRVVADERRQAGA
ncbi:MAG: ABC transporter ATP-binding protein [Thermoanaerobaculia bacterium]|nr:ABC transporter ATP-binding protein [Thermoanaerobaculia bacterium]